MLDSSTFGIVVYIQVGLFILGYVFYRWTSNLRLRVTALETNYESLLHHQDDRLAALECKLHQAQTERGRDVRKAQRLDTATRQRALEMAKRGEDVLRIARTLDMQPAQVEFLRKLDRLQRGRVPIERPEFR